MSNVTITEEQRLNMAFWSAKARQLCEAAREDGVIVTIELEPRKPLAMGHYDQVVDVRPKRVMDCDLAGEVRAK